MFTTMKRMAINAGLSNEEVTTFGLSLLGIVVVHGKATQDHMLERGYPLHSTFGKKFFFCFMTRCY